MIPTQKLVVVFSPAHGGDFAVDHSHQSAGEVT